MTTFAEQISADLDDVFFTVDEFADIATYSNGGIPVDINVILTNDALVQLGGYEAGVTTLGTTIQAKVADVGTVNSGDTFTIDSVVYTVKRIENNDGKVVELAVK